MTLAKGTPDIIRGSDQMFNIVYEGNGGGQRVGNFVPFTDNGTISNSCIFNRPDDPMLAYTPSGTGTNRRKYTISLWFKPSFDASDSNERALFFAGPYGNDDGLTLKNARTLNFWINGTSSGNLITNRTFEDSSKFYHILVAVDTTQSTASDRVKMYVDGDQITSFATENYPTQNYDGNVSTAVQHNVGAQTGNNRQCDGYLAEVNYVDGTALTPSTFGLTDTSTGRWIPKTLTGITYGTNGFRLQFANSAGQTIGDDTSGNGNDLTVTNLAASDITTDSPTQNHMTFDPLRSSDWTFTEGNLTCVGTPSSGAGRHSLSNMIMPKSGKYYFEMTVDVNNDSPRYFGLAKADASVTEGTTANVLPRVVNIRNGGTSDGHFISDGTSSSANGFATTSGTVINFALDATNEKLYVGKDGNYYDFEGGSGNPTNGTGATFSNIYKTIDWRAINMSFSTGSGGTSHKVTWNFGQKTFAHTAPTGFSALQQDNFPETSKGVPGLTWIKDRDNTYSHGLRDSSRGRHKDIFSNLTQGEVTNTDGVQKFLKGGIQIEDLTGLNASGSSIVSWNWVGNGGTEVANTDGSGATYASTIQANQTAGFSIVRFTPGSSSGKVAHGLSQAPEWIMMKDLSRSVLWLVYHKSVGADKYLRMDNADAAATNSTVYSTVPTASVFDPGTGYTSGSSYGSTIAYCWHSVPGFSKFGSYEGNANSNGPFINLGFKPAWLMIKNMDRSVDWIIIDNKRDPTNVGSSSLLKPNDTDAESEANNQGIDLLSNGFKVRQSSSNAFNASSETHIYMAFAEHPFLGDGTNPATAR